MRKTAIPFLAIGLAVVLASPALATNLMSEIFAYPNGSLVPNGGWATHSGSGTDIQIVSGRAVGSMLNAPDDNRSFTAQAATAKVYACFNVVIPSSAVAPDTNYFAHFKDTGTTNFLGRVWLGASGSTFTFGLSSTSCACNTNCVPVFWSTPLLYDHEYVVTVSYDGSNGNSELWVDAVNESSPKITATGGPVGTVSLSAFALRQSNAAQTGCPAGSFAWGYSVDNLGVGTTFADACNFGPTPTRNGTWGQLKTIYR
jgi:hypothetical protein